MYKFHYDYVMNKYGYERAHLLLTDTDSLLYEIETEDIYEDMNADEDEFDFARYSKSSKYYNPKNNKVLGKFKDETSGDPILEVVALRPKMYSIQTYSGEHKDPKEKHRAKGIPYAESSKLQHKDYLNQLNSPTENYICARRIGSNLHQLYTIEQQKRGLCAYDDKRFVLQDGMFLLYY